MSEGSRQGVDNIRFSSKRVLRQHPVQFQNWVVRTSRVFSVVPACVQRSWMRLGVCVNTCASMRAAVILQLVPACVQRSWRRVGVCIHICASMHAAVVLGRGY